MSKSATKRKTAPQTKAAPSARGLARAMGCGRAALRERDLDDFYPTAPEITRALIRAEHNWLRDKGPIWEAAVGDGAMANVLEGQGFEVIGSDLVKRAPGYAVKDFYQYKVPPGWVDILVTNPPFKECAKSRGFAWIKHAYDLGLEHMALLLPTTWQSSAAVSEVNKLWRPARVLNLTWRPDWTGEGSPTQCMSWFIWDGRQRRVTHLKRLSREGLVP